MKLAILMVMLIGVILVGTVSADINTTNVYVLDESGTIPFSVWAGAIILGLVLIIISFVHFPAGEEGLVSILAWIPIGFAMFTSFSVDMVAGAGVGAGLAGTTDVTTVVVHNIHHFDTIAVALMVLLAFAIGNTYRIAANQRKLREMAQSEQTWSERNKGGGIGE